MMKMNHEFEQLKSDVELKMMRAAKYRKALDIINEIEELLSDDEGWESTFFELRWCVLDHARDTMKYNEKELRENGLGTDDKLEGSNYRTLAKWAKEREESIEQFTNDLHRDVMYLLSKLEHALEENSHQIQRDFTILLIANQIHSGLIYRNTGKVVRY